MQDDLPFNDPRTIWQNQPTEPSAMTLLLIQKKVQELHAKTRSELLRSISGTLIAVTLGGFGLRFSDPAMQAVFACAMAWSIAGLYLFHRGMWSASAPEGAALRSGLASYRREVERRRFLFGRALRWLFGPVLLALAAWVFLAVKMGILTRTTLPKAAPFLTLLAVWLGAVFVIRMRQQRELQREIDDLNEIESSNR